MQIADDLVEPWNTKVFTSVVLGWVRFKVEENCFTAEVTQQHLQEIDLSEFGQGSEEKTSIGQETILL